MDCEQALEMIVAVMDREILPEDRLLLDAHVQECAECRANAEAFRLQDSALRRSFVPRRQASALVAERVIAQVRASPGPRMRHRTGYFWLPYVAAAAAGFLLAALLFRPWEKAPSVVVVEPPPDQPKLELVQQAKDMVQFGCSSDVVLTQPPGRRDWRALKPGEEIALGTRVRTGPRARCEFRTSDGSEVRLNNETELLFAASRRLDLIKGQIMTRVAKSPAPFQVAIPDATVTALGTEFDIQCKPDETVLTVLEGATEVKGSGVRQIVETGEAAFIVKGRVERKEQGHNLIHATSWVHELLMLKGPNNQELAKRVDDILAQIGQSKAEFFDEESIRSLGDHCVLPLSRFIQSGRSQGDLQKRRMAANIVADLAQPWSIPDLIRLLSDVDKDVRFHAARGLRRLTRQTFGREPEQWRDRPATCAAALKQWQTWWEENKHRYPNLADSSSAGLLTK